MKSNFAKSQQGVASVLTVALVGIALIVSISGTAFYLRTKQYAATSSHALTQAQADVWAGVEIVQKYLNTLNATDLEALETNGFPSITGLPNGIGFTVTIEGVEPPVTGSSIYTVTSTIKSRNTNSKSAASVQVVCDVNLASSGGGNVTPTQPKELKAAMNFYTDLNTGGDITLVDTGDKSIINIDGNFTTAGISLNGVKTINSTGDVTLDSGVPVDNVYANGTITLSGSAVISKIASAGKKINVKSSNQQGALHANQDINIENSSTVQSANTLQNIKITNGGARIVTALSGGEISCPGTWWNNFTSFQANSFSTCPTQNTLSPPATPPTGALATVSMDEQPLINALDYEESANYIFSVDSNNNIIVTVKNVQGVIDDDYYLGRQVASQSVTYLCKTVNTSNGVCTSATYSLGNSINWGYTVVTYSSGTWKLTDTQSKTPSLAPGVLLFKGNVELTQGNYHNAVFATGNITYGTSIVLKAPNYLGTNGVCNTSFNMPTNLCTSTTEMTKASVGNVALLAGSCNDASSLTTCKASYQGGTIKLTSSATIYGNIIAGNILETSGNTTVKGAILVAGLGNIGAGSKLGASTTIDFNGLKDDHPDFSVEVPTTGGGSNDSGNNTGSGTAGTTIKWARYL